MSGIVGGNSGALCRAGKYLSVALRDKALGLPVLRVREIIEKAAITPVPTMPPFVRGAINLRGRGLPVVDLSLRLGGVATDTGRRTCIVIVEVPARSGGSFDVGLLVDGVNEVLDLGESDIEPTPTFGGQLRSEFLAGMAKRNDAFIVMLDVERLLSLDVLEGIDEDAAPDAAVA